MSVRTIIACVVTHAAPGCRCIPSPCSVHGVVHGGVHINYGSRRRSKNSVGEPRVMSAPEVTKVVKDAFYMHVSKSCKVFGKKAASHGAQEGMSALQGTNAEELAKQLAIKPNGYFDLSKTAKHQDNKLPLAAATITLMTLLQKVATANGQVVPDLSDHMWRTKIVNQVTYRHNEYSKRGSETYAAQRLTSQNSIAKRHKVSRHARSHTYTASATGEVWRCACGDVPLFRSRSPCRPVPRVACGAS